MRKGRKSGKTQIFPQIVFRTFHLPAIVAKKLIKSPFDRVCFMVRQLQDFGLMGFTSTPLTMTMSTKLSKGLLESALAMPAMP